MNTANLTRRDFLKLMALTTGGLMLVSCGDVGGDPNKKQVRIMVDSWALSYAPFSAMAEKYNALHPEVQIRVEASPGGWQNKVIGQIRANELLWCAAGVMTTFADLTAWVQLDLIQPLDAYLSASQEVGAAEFIADMLPAVKEENSLDGKMYGIPFSVENITYQWNHAWFAKAGITTAPRTWQELYDYGQAVKTVMAAEGKTNTYALGFDLGWIVRNLGALLCSISDQPYTADGMLDWQSEAMRESLRFMRKLSRDGITPPDCGEGADIYDMWKRGRLAGLYSTSSRGVWAQKELGFDQVTTSRLPTVDGETHSGSVFWSNSVALLNKAPMPQEAIDFLIYAVGSQNSDWQKAIVQAGTSPAFNSAYTEIIANDPALADYRWMTIVRDEINISTPSPKNYLYQVQNEAWNRHRADYLNDESQMTEDELIQKILQTSQEILQQVLESVPTPVP